MKSVRFTVCRGLKQLLVLLLSFGFIALVDRAGVSSAAEKAGIAVRPSKGRPHHSPLRKGIIRGRVPETAKFYCGERIIAAGESRAEVLEKCGEPAWLEVREDTLTEGFRANRTPVNLVTTEEWIYNFGSAQLLYFLRFQGDRLAVIETGGYGYDDPAFGQNCADGKNVSLGDSRFEVLVKCGTPQEVGRICSQDVGQGQSPVIDANEWTYIFGPGRFTYTLIFKRGRVTDIRTGGYGH
jgi:hypothetical protein